MSVLDDAYASLHEEVCSLATTSSSAFRIRESECRPTWWRKRWIRFSRRSQSDKGTGLGLSMIYGFAKQSRGHLRIYSEVGQGTTVKLYLPRALQDAIDLKAPAIETPRGQGETILVVEDDVTVRLIISDVLEELGYEVLRGLGRPPRHPAAAIRSPDRPHGVRRRAASHQRPKACGDRAGDAPRSEGACSSPAMRRTPRSAAIFSTPAWTC